MPVPDLRRPIMGEIEQSPAVALFRLRAQAVNPEWDLSPLAALFVPDVGHPYRVQEISVVCRGAPAVNRPPGAQTVYLTFEGLRESRTIADKLTRVQIALPVAQAQLLSNLLAALVAPDGQSDR